jgi:hypothetical protein
MSISLYDASVASYLQVVSAVSGFLEKGKKHFNENNVNLEDVVSTRLYPDMLPFRFQVISVVHHSLGAMRSLESGEFGPPTGFPDYDYEGLQGLVSETLEALQKYSAEDVNALAGGDVTFKFGETSMPFTAPNFVLSFSHPNVYFHAATAYDILRTKGVALGKRDFMGMPRMKT